MWSRTTREDAVPVCAERLSNTVASDLGTVIRGAHHHFNVRRSVARYPAEAR
ncbi:hypothetical protein THIOKS1440020 [Thiocapsa sp. KS1]|nr:hypothetical protein THIOKS1440020 [Thiocapsa sp. KS1]